VLEPVVGLLARGRSQSKRGPVAKIASLIGVFLGYAETPPANYEVGNDERLLGLSPPEQATVDAVRLLCRHNRYVLDYGRVRGLAEIVRREQVWTDVIRAIERDEGVAAARLSPQSFDRLVSSYLETTTFQPKLPSSRSSAA
jgi:hypothetical protein